MAVPKSCFGFCISPRIELVIWACISVTLPIVTLCFFLFALAIASGFAGGQPNIYAEEVIFILVLLVEIIYHLLIIAACLGKNVQLLRISFYIGIVLWFILIISGAVLYSEGLEVQLKGFISFICLILIRGYMILLLRNVMLMPLQKGNQRGGYIDLDETTETRTGYGRSTQPVV